MAIPAITRLESSLANSGLQGREPSLAKEGAIPFFWKRAVLMTSCFFGFLFFSADTSYAAMLGRPINQLGLVAYWSFDSVTDKVYDHSGNGNHGYFYGAGTSTILTLGKMGQAASFGGVDEQFYTPSMSWASGGPVTVSFWVYSPTQTQASTVFSIGGDRNSERFQAHVPWYQDNLLYWDYGTHAGAGRISTDYSNYLNKWTYVTLVSEGNGGSFRAIYLDGELANSIGSSDGPDVPLSSARIGTDDGTGDFFNGNVDDFRVYNRVLSAQEIKRLYNSTVSKFSTSKTPTGLQNGLIGHWTFDGADMTPNVRDRSGQGNHGNITGQISTTTGIGKMSQALLMDGSDDVVTVPMPTTVTDNFTMTIWAIWNGVNSNAAFMYNGNTGADGYGLFLSNASCGSGGTIDILIGGKNCAAYSGTNTMPSGVWTHLALVRDNGDWKMYINGALVSSGYSLAPNTPTGNLLIGSGVGGGVDDARMYNRALTAAEIGQLYNIGSSKVSSSANTKNGSLGSGLVGHWTFDGADMTPNVRDKSGQGNHGNLNGQTSTTTAIGRIGQALLFDGTDDYITISENDSLDLTGDLTIATWYKLNSVGAYDAIFNKGGGSTQFGFGGSSGGDGFFLCKFGVICIFTHQGSHNLDTWEHVAITKVGNRFNLYVNGVSVYEIEDSTTFSGNSENAYISLDTGVRHMDGALDDLRVYNRGLSASEIMLLYNMGR